VAILALCNWGGGDKGDGAKYDDSKTTWVSSLKVPKRENFLLAFFALSEPIWVCDLGSGEKNRFFYQMIPYVEGLWFFAAY
jgi:hypothetical protein